MPLGLQHHIWKQVPIRVLVTLAGMPEGGRIESRTGAPTDLKMCLVVAVGGVFWEANWQSRGEEDLLFFLPTIRIWKAKSRKGRDPAQGEPPDTGWFF